MIRRNDLTNSMSYQNNSVSNAQTPFINNDIPVVHCLNFVELEVANKYTILIGCKKLLKNKLNVKAKLECGVSRFTCLTVVLYQLSRNCSKLIISKYLSKLTK